MINRRTFLKAVGLVAGTLVPDVFTRPTRTIIDMYTKSRWIQAGPHDDLYALVEQVADGGHLTIKGGAYYLNRTLVIDRGITLEMSENLILFRTNLAAVWIADGAQGNVHSNVFFNVERSNWS
jgi:hypothetical protein